MKPFRNLLLIVLAGLILGGATVIARAQTSAEQAKVNTNKAIDYTLPYPGILPDNVLYKFKVVRDKVFEFLITDPVKKADFYLLQADKRMAAGETLIDYGKPELGEETISKAENYMSLAVNYMYLAKQKGRSDPGLQERLKKSLEKHNEIVLLLKDKTSAEIKAKLAISDKTIEELHLKMLKLDDMNGNYSSSSATTP